jgi:branched-subunit amino acid ABC-type transport system permease component
MSEYWPFIVIGIATGSIYAMAAMGLVLTYKTSGIFNFAHGAVGAAAAFVFYDLRQRHHVPWVLALIISVVIFGAVLGLALELIARGLSKVPLAMRVVGTVGLLLTIQGLAVLRYGSSPLTFKPFLPQRTIKITSVYVGYDQLITAVLAVAVTVALYLFFKQTRIGTAMRAVVDDSDLLDMAGISPTRVRRLAWMLGSMLASLAGILIAPLLGLDAMLLTLLVVQAFGAAAVGRFTNLPLTYAGGLLLGILHELVGKWVGTNEKLSALPSAVPFFMLFAVLLFTRRGALPDFSRLVQPRVKAITAPWRGRYPTLAVVLVLACLAPALAGTKTILFATGLTYVGLFLSIGLLTRLSGMVSLCQIGLAAVGAAMFGHLQGEEHLPWLLALVLAGLIAVPFGAIVAIPAIRLSGLYLTLATFGYATLLEQVLYRMDWMFSTSEGVHASRPAMFTSDRGYYYAVLAVGVALALGVRMIERTRLGRLLRALGDSPRALASHGASVNVTRVIVFCVAAFLAGVSGALYVPLFGSVNGDSFPTFLSLILLAVLAICGTDIVRASFISAIAYFVAPGYINNHTLTTGLPALFGVIAVVVALTSNGAGPVAWAGRLVATSGWRVARSPVSARYLDRIRPAKPRRSRHLVRVQEKLS